MSVQVKFFASLAERLGRTQARLEIECPLTVAEVWMQATLGESLPGTILAAVNMDYAAPDTLVHDGDEVAFFPPVTGG